MSSQTVALKSTRRTTADKIFDQLYADIMALRLLPGAKLSESEIAKKNDVSRQPVREAFIQLNNKGLLNIRPQKATTVRKISIRAIRKARFIRTAVEIEVIRHACENVTKQHLKMIEANVKSQHKAAIDNDASRFHALDYEFHRLICVAADTEFAFTIIEENKTLEDRLCMICLTDKQRMLELVDDHSRIFEALQAQDAERMIELTRIHLSRLNITLRTACEEHDEYFEE